MDSAPRVAVSGSDGKVGRFAVADLLASGCHVVAIDRAAADTKPTSSNVTPRVIDLGDPGAVHDALAGCDAVIHLAALTDPVNHDHSAMFANNLSTTFNVLNAAARHGITRAVVASSQSVLGHPWAADVLPLDYIPVDEAHPCRPIDPYGLSKQLCEEMCSYFARSAGIRILSFRFPSVWLPEQFPWRPNVRITDVKQAAKSLWSYVDVRDAARACRLALTNEWSGHEVLNITSRWAIGAAPVSALVAQWYPATRDIRATLDDCTAIYDWHKAERILGFRAHYRWLPSGIVDMGDA